MINKITRKEFKGDFGSLLGDFLENSYQEHRRGSNFFTRSIVEINEEWYPELDRELDGFWETNQYIWDDDYGADKSEIYELDRVERVTKVVTTTEWVKIK